MLALRPSAAKKLKQLKQRLMDGWVHLSHLITFSEHDVRRALKCVNTKKAAGPDGISWADDASLSLLFLHNVLLKRPT